MGIFSVWKMSQEAADDQFEVVNRTMMYSGEKNTVDGSEIRLTSWWRVYPTIYDGF